MKYFTQELHEGINSHDPEIRKLASDEWKKRCEEYHKYYSSISHKLPKTLINSLKDHGEFHDYYIEEIKYKDNPQEVFIKLQSGTETFYLCFSGVSSIEIDVCDKSWSLQNRLSWTDCELDISKNGYIINIGCDFKNEIKICFESFKIKKGQQKSREKKLWIFKSRKNR